MPKRHSMTNWYDPARLVSIGVRVAVSTVFGEFADRREAMAAAREIDPGTIDPCYDYRSPQIPEEPFWFDFVADTGDGWNPTYAIARMLAEGELKVDGIEDPLPRGRFLVMGGDQVYPTASREDYGAKLVEPYNQAARDANWPKGTEADLYAIPGNHDWYDGLLAFLGVFCDRRLGTAWSRAKPGREFGNRLTKQTRSYFALALPNNWWLWGVDIQLDGYVDQPQIDFFDHVARAWMPQDGARLIICSGQPEWAYVDVTAKEKKTFKNFSYLERVAFLANPKHQLRVVLSGDSHHYSRFTEGNRQYFTAGGGGAFLHPTHHLASKSFDWKHPQPNQPKLLQNPPDTYRREFVLAETTFPDAATSRRLTWRNLAFACLNPGYTAVLGIACAFFAWLLNANALVSGTTLGAALAGSPTFWSALYAYLELVLLSPWPLALVSVAIAGYYYFAAFKPFALRLVVGLLHASAQLSVVVTATILLARYMPWASTPWLFISSVGICGGALAATVMSTYLLFCLNALGKHPNEAFSSLRIQGYKNFLRLRIDPDGRLAIFPIGLRQVPQCRNDEALDISSFRSRLIEKPVVIG